MKPGHVEISGAGFAGLTAAAAFAQRGWSVRVHERAPDLRTAGAGIFIFQNGLRVLRAIGALEDAIRGGHQAPARETRDPSGKVISRFEFKVEQRIYTVVRQQLLEAIAAAARKAGAEIVTGSEVLSADPSGAVTVSGGITRSADLIVVADGVNSRIRDALGLLRSRKRLGDGAIRVLIPRLPEERDGIDSQNVVEHWSGKRRLLYVPCGQSDLYLALTTLERDAPGHALPLRQEEWCRSFPHLRSLIERIGTEGRWDPFEVITLDSWSAGRIAIVGDAAHAQAPNLGQGGGCAMMNALGLAVAVERSEDLASGLQDWERRERPLTEQVQRVSSLYSVVGAWPDALRSLALSIAGRSKWMVGQRMRAARHIPTGT